MDAEDPSPLRRFVIAKRSISSIFDQLLDFVKDGSAFVDGQKHTELYMYFRVLNSRHHTSVLFFCHVSCFRRKAELMFVCCCLLAVMSEAWHSDDLGQVAVEEQSLEMQSCATKLSTIRDVLLRRHMKVAFFGR